MRPALVLHCHVNDGMLHVCELYVLSRLDFVSMFGMRFA
jgi:hypothetical protein